MNSPSLPSRLLVTIGGAAMLVGAVDPLEGSILILLGSGLFALGVFLARSGRRLVAYRLLVFGLIAAGVIAMFGLTLIGGVGGSTGRSPWWALLVLPYPIGWSLGVWGPGSPRWMLWLGMAVGMWYFVLLGLIAIKYTPCSKAGCVKSSPPPSQRHRGAEPAGRFLRAGPVRSGPADDVGVHPVAGVDRAGESTRLRKRRVNDG